MKAALLALLLAGCAAPGAPFMRADGRSVQGDPTLALQADRDVAACRGEAARGKLSGASGSDWGTIFARNKLAADVFEGCLADRGYVRH